MQTKTYKVFGVEFPYEVSSSVEEMNQLAGDDIAHDAALAQIIFHTSLGKIRKAVVEAVEKLFPDNQRKRHAEKIGDKEVVVVDEKDGGYITRLLADGVLAEAKLADLVTAAAAANPYEKCLVRQERAAARPKTLPKKVAAFIAGLDEAKRTRLAAKMAKALKREVDAADDDAFGFAYLAYREYLEAEMLTKL